MRLFRRNRKSFVVLLAALLSAAAAIAVGVGLANRGPLPTMLAQRGISMLERQIPLQIELGRAHFSSPLQLVLSDVTVTAPAEVGLTEPVQIKEVQLNFSPLSVLRGQHLAGLEQINIIQPEITMDYQQYLQWVMPAARTTVSTSTVPGTRQTGVQRNGTVSAQTAHAGWQQAVRQIKWPRLGLLLRGGKFTFVGNDAPDTVYFDVTAYSNTKSLQVSRVDMRRGAGHLQLNGNLDTQGNLHAKVDLTDWLAMDMLGWYPACKLQGRGSVSGQAEIAGTIEHPTATGQVWLRGARLTIPGSHPIQYLTLTQGTTRFQSAKSGWELTGLEIATSTGKLTGEGSVSVDRLDLQVAARNLQLPMDLPLVAVWGVSGKAAFSGTVTGTWGNPELAGKVTLQQGQLWNTAVDSAHGLLRLTKERFQFDQVQITKSGSRYHLQGALTGLDTRNQTANVRLDSQAGRVEDLLSVLALPVDARGQIDGLLTFSGPFTGIVTAGQVTVRNALVYGEPLDWAQGGFRWGDGKLALDNVRGRLDQGSLLAAGSAALDGSAMQINIDAHDWPLEKITHIKALAPNWRGSVSWMGTLQGSVTDPLLDGQLVAKNIGMGKTLVKQVVGPVALRNGDLSTSGLLATTDAGGMWWLNGKIAQVMKTPQLDFSLQVEDESLSGLLAMGGYRIPAALVDGAVNGKVRVQGPLQNPQTRLQLSLAEQGLDMGDALRLDLLIADRRVKVLGVS